MVAVKTLAGRQTFSRILVNRGGLNVSRFLFSDPWK